MESTRKAKELLEAAARKFKKIDVSFLCVCPVIDHEFRHNIVKVAVDPRGDSCQPVLSRSLSHRIIYKFMCLSVN